MIIATPAQCLAEHDREVAARAFDEGVKAGFMISSEGFNGECWFDGLGDKWKIDGRELDDVPKEAIKQAKEYANKIKSGEVEI